MARWPEPADTALDRARAVCYSYRQALMEVDPQRCAVLDQVARELGEHWIAPLPDTAPGTLVSTERAAQLSGVSPATVRGWGSKPGIAIKRYPGGWDMDEIREHQASQRRRRGHR